MIPAVNHFLKLFNIWDVVQFPHYALDDPWHPLKSISLSSLENRKEKSLDSKSCK
jgi:hypothetical protein